MSIEQHYQNPTSGATTFDDVLTGVRLGDDGFVEDGQLGAVGTSSVYVDDPIGSAIYRAWQRYYVLETAGPASLGLTGTVAKSSSSTTITGTGTAFLAECSPGDELVVPGGGGTDYLFVASVTDNTHLEVYIQPAHSASGQSATRAAQQRLWSGWTGPDYGLDRGSDRPGGGEFIDAGRVWSLDLAEGNTALHFRIGRSAAWKKTGAVGSATTWGARLVAILATSEVAGRFYDDGLVDYPTTACDAADVSNQYLDEILSSMAQATGYNFSADYHEATGHWQLIVKKPDTYFLPSPLKISNYAADDAAALTYHPAPPDARLVGAGSGIFGGIQVVGARLSAYRTDASVADVYEFRDVNASDSSLKTLAKIQAYGDRQLIDGASPDEKVQVTIVVPASSHHLARRLRAIEVRFEHLLGWEDWGWAIILRREMKHAVADNGEPIPDHYELSLVLSQTAEPVPPTASYAEIQYPQADDPSFTSGPALLNWSNTGDSPKSPRTAHPLVGLMAYDATAVDPSFPSDKTGIKMLGGGLVDIHCQAGFEFAYSSGSGKNVTLTVYKNGVSIGSGTKVDTGSGIHAVSGYITVDLTGITVANGDIITAKLSWVTTIAIGAIPVAGTNGTTYMSVQGTLS